MKLATNVRHREQKLIAGNYLSNSFKIVKDSSFE